MVWLEIRFGIEFTFVGSNPGLTFCRRYADQGNSPAAESNNIDSATCATTSGDGAGWGCVSGGRPAGCSGAGGGVGGRLTVGDGGRVDFHNAIVSIMTGPVQIRLPLPARRPRGGVMSWAPDPEALRGRVAVVAGATRGAGRARPAFRVAFQQVK